MADAPVLKFPAGMNNRDREYALPEGALREATNLDVTRDGGLISRKGLREILSANCHSLYTPPHGRFLLLVADGALQCLEDPELMLMNPLCGVVGPVVYASLNDEVFWTDGNSVGRVLRDGTASVWGMATPPQPICSAVSTGGLYAGTYQVAMTAAHSSGLESGAADTVSVEVPDGGGIQVTTPNASGVRFALYRTPAQGGQDELRQALVANPGTTPILGVAPLGKPLESLHVERPLPGQCLIAHKGRLWCASRNVVWFTDTKSPHWLRPDQGYFQFESDVTMLAAAEDGVYVGTVSQVYFLQGNDPFKAQQRPVSSVGVASGTAFEIPYDLFLGDDAFPSRQAAWWDTDGYLCIGKPGGIIVRPTQKQFTTGKTRAGVLTYRAYQGLRQLVSALNTESGPLMATDIDVSQVFANGVVLSG